jgi:hypothetical protein
LLPVLAVIEIVAGERVSSPHWILMKWRWKLRPRAARVGEKPFLMPIARP